MVPAEIYPEIEIRVPKQLLGLLDKQHLWPIYEGAEIINISPTLNTK